MFTVHQVRLGLATNSSSSHSIIVLPPGSVRDNDVDGEFGWGNFTCASTEAKLLYAGVQLQGVMARIAGDDVAEAVASHWTGVDVPADGYIDHESQWSFPLTWDGRSVDKEFFSAVLEYLKRPEVVVLGGNDNSDGHPLSTDADGNKVSFTPLFARTGGMVCRNDGTHWVLFNRANGTKVRMTFGEELANATPTKAAAPELVDLKITDFCPYGCEFCYQGSTLGGSHGDTALIKNFAHSLAHMRVFEVAIGGGEPTLHPDFVDILQTFREQGVVPNFTTKNTQWIKDAEQRVPILANVGAFAVSVEDADEIRELGSLLDSLNVQHDKANVQYVMGTGSLDDLAEIFDAAVEAKLRLTLLDYKTDGRGSEYAPEDYTDWVQVLQAAHAKHRYALRVGIDTPLAARSKADLDASGIPDWCYETKEGAFSMYVDAVTKKTGRASYGSSLTMRPIKAATAQTRVSFGGHQPSLTEELLEHFAAY